MLVSRGRGSATAEDVWSGESRLVIPRVLMPESPPHLLLDLRGHTVYGEVRRR